MRSSRPRLSHVALSGEQIRQGDGFVAVWAGATGTDPSAELVAVGAALLAQEARTAGWALVDGPRAWYTGRKGGQCRGMAASPGGLAAGG